MLQFDTRAASRHNGGVIGQGLYRTPVRMSGVPASEGCDSASSRNPGWFISTFGLALGRAVGLPRFHGAIVCNPMNDAARLTKLEELFSHLQDHVLEQDKVVLALRDDLSRLRKELAMLRLRDANMAPPTEMVDERPPHY